MKDNTLNSAVSSIRSKKRFFKWNLFRDIVYKSGTLINGTLECFFLLKSLREKFNENFYKLAYFYNLEDKRVSYVESGYL